MKKNINKILTAFLVFLLSANVFSQTFVEEQDKSFGAKISTETSLEISNQYGDIEFNTWEKDSIKINIHIRIESKKEENIAKANKGLGFAFDHSKSYVRCATKYTGDGMALGYRNAQITNSYKHLIIFDRDVHACGGTCC